VRTLLTYALAALAAATATTVLIVGPSSEPWLIERAPGLFAVWTALWAVAGSTIWFAKSYLLRRAFGWGNRSFWTIIRAGVVFAGVAFVCAIPLFGFEIAENARLFYRPERQEWYFFALDLTFAARFIAPFAAVTGFAWGLVFWLREPKSEPAGQAI
jgi:hypothetical protein